MTEVFLWDYLINSKKELKDSSTEEEITVDENSAEAAAAIAKGKKPSQN